MPLVKTQAAQSVQAAVSAPAPSWNIVITAQRWEQKRLREQLIPYGDFQTSHLRGVLTGQVRGVREFFEELSRAEANDPQFFTRISKIVPVDYGFSFTGSRDFHEQAEKVMLKYLDAVGDRTFHLRCDRRGLGDELNSTEIERRLGEVIYETLKARGKSPHVKFKDPDILIACEIVGSECGIGMISRELRRQFPFLKMF